MSFSIYDLEAEQEGRVRKDSTIDMTSAMVSMTASFGFCAVFMALVLSGLGNSFAFMVFVFLRTLLIVGIMLLAASILAYMFNSSLVRRVNAMVVGMIMAFALIFMNI